MAAFPWVRLALGLLFVVAAVVLARRTIVACEGTVCRYGDQRIVGGDVREVQVDAVERMALDRTMNREGERRSQAVFLMKSGAKIPATPMDERDKSEIVTSFAALQSGARTRFVDADTGAAAWAAGAMGALGAIFLLLFALAWRRAATSSR